MRPKETDLLAMRERTGLLDTGDDGTDVNLCSGGVVKGERGLIGVASGDLKGGDEANGGPTR